jgi:hypothetical protein
LSNPQPGSLSGVEDGAADGEPFAVANGGHVTLWFLTNALARSILLRGRLVKV